MKKTLISVFVLTLFIAPPSLVQAEEDAQVKDAPSAADQSPDKDFVEGKDAEGAEAAGAAEAGGVAE